VLAPIDGEVEIDGRKLSSDHRALLPPGEARAIVVRALSPARLIRTTVGPGYGFVVSSARRAKRTR
jgi:hypothetical protein